MSDFEEYEKFEEDRRRGVHREAQALPEEAAHAETTLGGDPGSAGPRSNMKGIGQLLVVLGLAAVMVAAFAAGKADEPQDVAKAAGWMYLATAAAGAGAFMWMLGIIEQRLVEIRDRLPQ